MGYNAELSNLCIVLIVAFLFNFVWEEMHSPLYLHYRGGEIAHLILFRAAVVDAIVIFSAAALCALLPIPRARTWIFLSALLAIAIMIEQWATSSGRWAYAVAMPVIPFLGTGLTPTVQLALTGYVSVRLVNLLPPLTKYRKRGKIDKF